MALSSALTHSTHPPSAPGLPRVFGPRVSHVLRAYYLGPDHPWKIRLWRLLRRALGEPRLTLPYGRGGWITVHEGDYLQRAIFVSGAYEPEVWNALSEHATHAEVVWDVGANIGTFALRAARDPRVQSVHAFEPDPVNARLLAFHNQLNQHRFQIHQLALSDRSERKRLTHGPTTNTGMSSLADAGLSGADNFDVECQTADELVSRGLVPAPTLLKIDVEGWEPFVLRGAQRLLEDQPPKAIVFEADSRPSGATANAELWALLERSGYEISHIQRPDGSVKTHENYLAARRRR